jgi:hypothetical protein
MLNRSLVFIVSFIVTTFTIAAAQEPVKPKLTPHIITATRQVTIFTGLEKQMLQAIQQKDKAGLEAMLSDDFTIDMPNADPLPGDDWLDSVMTKDFLLKSFVVRQMSVIDLGNAAVVKFDRIQEASSKTEKDNGEFFVVDLWQKSGDTWKLANRFVSKISSVPLVPKNDVKPTGKQ